MWAPDLQQRVPLEPVGGAGVQAALGLRPDAPGEPPGRACGPPREKPPPQMRLDLGACPPTATRLSSVAAHSKQTQ